jgi:hypothetical protein
MAASIAASLAGVIPGYAQSANGAVDATAFYFRQLDSDS